MINKKKVLITEMIGVVLIVLIGSLFHFLYDWTGNSIIALISPVNESNWEHIKIMFYPYMIIAAIEYLIIGKDVDNYVFGKAIGVFVFIIVAFSLTIIAELFTSHPSLIFHLIAYTLAAIAGQYMSYRIIINNKIGGKTAWMGWLVIIIIGLIITVFTYYPLHNEFFMDRNTMTYGISKDS